MQPRERQLGEPGQALVVRDALDAAFGLARGEAPEHYRIAKAALDLLAEVLRTGRTRNARTTLLPLAA